MKISKCLFKIPDHPNGISSRHVDLGMYSWDISYSNVMGGGKQENLSATGCKDGSHPFGPSKNILKIKTQRY